MKYYFFLDETGDHGLDFIDKNFPLFLLCGCLIREDHLTKLGKQVNAFKLKYFKTTGVILHSRKYGDVMVLFKYFLILISRPASMLTSI
jgi:hypothetical protein